MDMPSITHARRRELLSPTMSVRYDGMAFHARPVYPQARLSNGVKTMRYLLHTAALAAAMAIVPPLAAIAGNPWRQLAEQDLTVIHDTIGANHPGPADTRNPAFADWQERGFREAMELAAATQNFAGYKYALRHYVNGFRDGHLGLALDMDANTLAWPGIVVAWRDGAFRVHHVAPDLAAPHAGDELLACNGEPAHAMYTQRVLPYYGNPEIASSINLHAPRLLLDDGNPHAPQVARCTFRHGGKEEQVELAWRKSSMDVLGPLLQAARTGDAPAQALRRVAGHGSWLSLPSFGIPDAQADALKVLLAELPKHRDSDYFVIDVRGNGGGSSHWGQAVIAALYGESYKAWLQAQEEQRSADSYVEFRVSRVNADHFRDELPRIARNAGKDSIAYRYFDVVTSQLYAALARGDALLDDRPAQKQIMPASATPADSPAPAPLFKGRVFFLTDARCASACLDFADALLQIPGVVHVGQPTSGDTVYMDVNTVRLPSNAGEFGYATKVYRGRSRGHNASYTPVHDWKGDIWRTDQLEPWIMDMQKTDRPK